MAKTKEKDVIQAYLSKMDSKKFLKKPEEQRICKIVQDATDKILATCLPYPIFRKQLYKLKASIARNPDKIIKVLKDITEETPAARLHEVTEIFDNLFVAIEKQRGIKCTMSTLKFTNSAIMNMVNPIKDAYRDYIKIEDALKTSYNFLEVKSENEFDTLLKLCITNESALNKVARKLYSKPEVISKHIRSILDNRTKLEDFDAQPDYHSIKTLYKEITTLEEEVEKYRTRLIEANLPLVVNRAKRFIKSALDFEDLIQEGNIGLIKAVDKFEYDKGFRLTTYATWWIDQSIRRAISNKSSLVRIPIHIQDRLQKINRSYHKLCQEVNREPSLQEIADDTDINIGDVTKIMTSALHEVGLDTSISEGVTINDVLIAETESPVEITSKIIFQEKLRAALALLKPKYEKVLRLRFGIGEANNHTLEEIGQHLGLTKERIRQIEKRALQHVSKKDGIKDGF